MWAIGEIDSLLSVKVSIRQRIKNHKKKKIQEKAKKKSSPDSCVKCYTMFLPFLLIKIDVFS
ncbi:hypothetical protein F9B65_03140, partial [Staphylococcus epidermidis]